MWYKEKCTHVEFCKNFSDGFVFAYDGLFRYKKTVKFLFCFFKSSWKAGVFQIQDNGKSK